ncbi:MAG: response regulator [Rhodanobacteraceae bacterium]|jgi:two-component system cell cycle response regulator DivK|nr:response regulator [Rhodanobacteraceae bacterium]MBL0040476.1 response regulator [Xanthomonadales bacterium]MBP6079154.1 response regulator [Xanthomonadales bacterium]MBP7624063.1 response regulator [Xanthomonadales bacterium]
MSRDILLIEDNENNRYLVRFLLEQAGHRVRTAHDGPGGLAEARSLVPDLILLDIQLPGMDGHAVARALREHPSLAKVPVVAVTSYAMVGDRERSLDAGCNGYIEKPIDPDTFVTDVEQFMRPPTERAG